jgi:UDP-3-O-[3-hydroxymyristoyl] glucosamine N-acyltransferase
MSNTVIGKNTFLDNQIHVAHNVKIGDNCIVAAQVGFAGSSTLGNNVIDWRTSWCIRTSKNW